MLPAPARLLRLLSLFQAQRYWSGASLSERLEVTPRTLRRDVDRLRSLGYPVNSTPGAGGGYQLAAGSSLPPLLLDDDEAVAVAIGLRTAAGGTVTGIEEASLRALSKLEQLLPSRLRHRVAALHSSIVPLDHPAPGVDGERLSSLVGACRNQNEIRFRYRDRDGSLTQRTTEPHQLAHTGRRWYLVAWDLERDDWRTFRVDRLEPPLTDGRRFVPRTPPEGGFAAYVARSVSYAPYPHRAQIVLHVPVETIADRIPPDAGVLEAMDDRTCVLHTGAHSLDTLAVVLALLGVDFTVKEPPELLARVRQLAARFGRAG